MQEDRRIRKTKKALYGALVKLLRERELRNIPVQELCDLADIHRATFYYHYSDIYALYGELESKTLGEFTDALVSDNTHTYLSVYRNVLDHIRENAEVWTVLLSGRGSRGFRDKVAGIFREKFMEICRYETGLERFPEEFYLLAEFETSGFLAITIRWLNMDTVFPVDSLTALLRDIDLKIDELMESCLPQNAEEQSAL